MIIWVVVVIVIVIVIGGKETTPVLVSCRRSHRRESIPHKERERERCVCLRAKMKVGEEGATVVTSDPPVCTNGW